MSLADRRLCHTLTAEHGTDGRFGWQSAIWNENDDVGKLDQDSYLEMLKEAKQEGVKTPYHVYARTQTYQTNKVKFYQVPDKILLHLGLNENSDSYNNEENKLWN